MEKEQAAQFYRNRQGQREREELIKACRNGLKIGQSQNFGKRKRQDFCYDHVVENLEHYKKLFDIELSDFQTIKDLFECISLYSNDHFDKKAIKMELAKVWTKLLDPNIMSKFNNNLSQQAVYKLQMEAIRNIWYLVMNQDDKTIVPTIIEASSVDHLFQFFDDPDDICCSLYLKIENSHPELVDRKKIVHQATQLIERGKNENSVDVYFDVFKTLIKDFDELSPKNLKDLAEFAAQNILQLDEALHFCVNTLLIMRELYMCWSSLK